MAPRRNEELISGIPPREKFWVGVSAEGEIQIRGDGRHVYRNMKTTESGPLGTNKTFSLAITERCAKRGIGKLHWVECPATHQSGTRTKYKATERYLRIPTLLYEAYVWSREESEAWAKLPHVHRLQLLNARAGSILQKSPLLAVSMGYDEDPITPELRVYDSLPGAAYLYYDTNGLCFLGFLNEITAQSRGNYVTPRERRHHIVAKDDIAAFRIHSDQEMVDNLHDLFWDRRTGIGSHLYCFFEIDALMIEAHDEWVRSGQGTRETYPHVQKYVEQYNREIARLEGLDANMQALENLAIPLGLLSQDERTFLHQFEVVALRDTGDADHLVNVAALHMLVGNRTWNGMTQDNQRLVFEYTRLQRLIHGPRRQGIAAVQPQDDNEEDEDDGGDDDDAAERAGMEIDG